MNTISTATTLVPSSTVRASKAAKRDAFDVWVEEMLANPAALEAAKTDCREADIRDVEDQIWELLDEDGMTAARAYRLLAERIADLEARVSAH